jgi:hypothetical protein
MFAILAWAAIPAVSWAACREAYASLNPASKFSARRGGETVYGARGTPEAPGDHPDPPARHPAHPPPPQRQRGPQPPAADRPRRNLPQPASSARDRHRRDLAQLIALRAATLYGTQTTIGGGNSGPTSSAADLCGVTFRRAGSEQAHAGCGPAAGGRRHLRHKRPARCPGPKSAAPQSHRPANTLPEAVAWHRDPVRQDRRVLPSGRHSCLAPDVGVTFEENS